MILWIVIGVIVYLLVGIALASDVDGESVADKVEKVLTVFLWPLPGVLFIWLMFLLASAQTH